MEAKSVSKARIKLTSDGDLIIQTGDNQYLTTYGQLSFIGFGVTPFELSAHRFSNITQAQHVLSTYEALFNSNKEL